jgi:hypothetical protein
VTFRKSSDNNGNLSIPVRRWAALREEIKFGNSINDALEQNIRRYFLILTGTGDSVV